MRRAGLFLLALLLAASASAAPKYRIVINRFSASNSVADSLRERVTSSLRGELAKDHRVTVLESEEVAAVLLDPSFAQRTWGAFDPSTVVTPKLLAANYVLLGRIVREHDRVSLMLRLVEVETRGLAGATDREWQAGEAVPEMAGAVAQLLDFIPHASSVSPDGFVTFDVDPPEASVRFLNETEPRALPIRRLPLRPGRYSVAVIPRDEQLETEFAELRIDSGREATVRVKLRRKRVTLTIPPHGGAARYLDGVYLPPAATTYETESGRHEYVFVTPQGAVYRHAIDVGVGKPATVTPAAGIDALRIAGAERAMPPLDLDAVPDAMAADGAQVVVSHGGDVAAYDARSGVRQWIAQRDGEVSRLAITRDSVIVLRRWTTTTDTRSGTSTSSGAEVLGLAPDSGEKIWTSTGLSSAELLDVTNDGVLFRGDQNLYVRRPGASLVRRIDLDLAASTLRPELDTARLGGAGVVAVDSAGARVVSFYESGQRAWTIDVPDNASALFTLPDAVVIRTRGGRLLRVARDRPELVWAADVPDGAVFVLPSGRDLLLVSRNGAVWRVDAAEGRVAPLDLPLTGLEVVTHAATDALGRLLLVFADHRVALLDPAAMQFLWMRDFERRVQSVAAGAGFAAIATTDRAVALTALPAPPAVVGWIESVRAADGVIAIRTALDELPVGALAVVPFPALFDADAVAQRRFVAAGATKAADGAFTVPVPDAAGFTPGELVMRAGGLRLDVANAEALSWIDGWNVCRGACSVAGLTPGRHRLAAVAPGFDVLEQDVEVGEAMTTATITLGRDRSESRLKVATTPAGAAVYIDNTYLSGVSAPAEWTWPRNVQSANMRVQKPGYETVQRTLRRDQDRERVDVPLRQAAPVLDVVTGWRSAHNALGIGWSSNAISRSGVSGAPLRKVQRSPAFGRLDLQWSYRALSPFVSYDSSLGPGAYGFGARYRVATLPWAGETTVGAAFLLGAGAEGSSAPESGRGEPDDKAPLEEWTHPISGVFVRNAAPHFAQAQVIFRPLARTFIRLNMTRLLSETLRGTLLVTDPATGHLVKDETRSYAVEAEGGRRWSIEAETALTPLVHWGRVSPALMLYSRFASWRRDFPTFSDRGTEWSLGLGYVTYQSWGR